MIEGIFVLYQDCGQLPPAKARALVKRCKDNIMNLEEKFPNWRVLAIPVRSPQETELAAIRLTPKGVICLYIDVGSLSPIAAEAHIAHIKDDNRWMNDLEQAKVFSPVRCAVSQVDYLDLEEKDVEQETERT